jgi:hypothetical protein
MDDLFDPFSLAADRVRRRAPRREPDPISLRASQMGPGTVVDIIDRMLMQPIREAQPSASILAGDPTSDEAAAAAGSMFGAAGTAVTAGMPFAVRGALGAAGGKLKTAAPQWTPEQLAQAQALADAASGTRAPLQGLPRDPLDVGGSPFIPGPYAPMHDAAEAYMKSVGLPYEPMRTYQPVDTARAARIAEEYEKMPHAPDDPRVAASYDAMINETIAQYNALKDAGIKFEFIKPGMEDPYKATPRLAQKDVIENKHLWVFPTDSGFGSGTESAAAAMKNNPLLRPTDVEIDGKQLLANDLFRIVHDAYGHIMHGHGFRAAGEENAWRSHSRMYSDLARPAMTSETRGQNSWLNYGPHGEKNRTAKSEDTIYADQKIGLLPDWVVNEGRYDPPPPRNERNADAWRSFIETPEFRTRLDEMNTEGLAYMAQHPTKNWWDAQPFDDVYGAGRRPQIAGYTAATAPNSGLRDNVRWMSEYMRRFIKGEDIVQPDWRVPEGAMVSKAGSEAPMEVGRTNNLMNATSGDLAALSRNKVREEGKAMSGDPNAVVIDRHHIRLAEAPERGIYASTQEGAIGSAPLKRGKNDYEMLQEVITRAAKEAGLSPADYSANVWAGIRERIKNTGELYGQKFKASAIQGESKSYSDHLTDLIAEKAKHRGISVKEMTKRLKKGDDNLLSLMLGSPIVWAAYQQMQEEAQ